MTWINLFGRIHEFPYNADPVTTGVLRLFVFIPKQNQVLFHWSSFKPIQLPPPPQPPSTYSTNLDVSPPPKKKKNPIQDQVWLHR